MTSTEEKKANCRKHQQYVSDVFHTLGQPLTELQFALEMALHRPAMGPEEYRTAIRQALHATQRIIESSRFLRQLAEAEDPGSADETIDAAPILRQIAEEFDPVAESRRVEVGLLIEGALPVRVEPRRLNNLLTVMIDHGVQHAQMSTRLHVSGGGDPQGIRIEVSTVPQALLWGSGEESGTMPALGGETNRNLQIAKRIAEAAGGRLQVDEAGQQCRLTLRLPAAR